MNLLRSSAAGRFAFVAEALALVFVFLLPLKFGSIVGIPDITMIYWREWFPLVLSPWPPALLAPFAALLLLTVVLFVPKSPRWTWNGNQALLWLAFAGSGTLGAFAENTVVNYPMHMIPYGFGLACSALAFAMLLDNRPEFGSRLLGAVALGAVFSLYSGLSQYISGFDATLEQLRKMEAEGMYFHNNMKLRLSEQRISADFSACNAYAGYLLLATPVLVAWLWKAGARVNPPLLSRCLFAIPALLISGYVLLKTGSRGAVLAGGLALFVSLLALKLPRKIRWGVLALIPVGAGAFALMLALGRGVKSMIFRFDYFQAAFRMMLESPWIGKGWGGFFQHYLTMKLLENDEEILSELSHDKPDVMAHVKEHLDEVEAHLKATLGTSAEAIIADYRYGYISSLLRGVLTPEKCPLFGRVCTPQNPTGPCMVSTEGSCAAWYRYRGM